MLVYFKLLHFPIFFVIFILITSFSDKYYVHLHVLECDFPITMMGHYTKIINYYKKILQLAVSSLYIQGFQ